MMPAQAIYNDPFGIYRNQSNEMLPPIQPKTDWIGRLIMLAALGVMIFVVGQNQGWWEGGEKREDRGDDRKEDVQPAPTNVDGWIVFIHERTPLSPSHVTTLDDAKAVAESIPGLDWRSIDEEDPAAKQFIDFAATKGVQPPMVVWRSADGKFRNAKSWPANDSEIKAVLK